MKIYTVETGTNSTYLPAHYVDSTASAEIVSDYLSERNYMTDTVIIRTPDKDEAQKAYDSAWSDYNIVATPVGYQLDVTLVELSEEEGEFDEDGDWNNTKPINVLAVKA